MGKTKIEWVINPDGTQGEVWNVAVDRCKLTDPLHWRKPRTVFVRDLFQEDVARSRIDAAWSIMAETRQHRFLVLTENADRLLEFMKDRKQKGWKADWQNIGFGVSVEDESTVHRIQTLLEIEAAFHFLSFEPALGQLDLRPFLAAWSATKHGGEKHYPLIHEQTVQHPEDTRSNLQRSKDIQATLKTIHSHPRLAWVIIGGESGPGARPMHPDWARSVRDQCKAAAVPFFHKQNGEWLPADEAINVLGDDHPLFRDCAHGILDARKQSRVRALGNETFVRVTKKWAGHHIDGEVHRELPEWLG